MQHRFFRFLVVSFLLVAPLRLKAAGYLFVFDGASPGATVYDAQSLQRLARPAVGRGAGYAFGVADPADARAIAKFYVVSESAIAILNADFAVRGNVFLPEPLAGGSNAATLSPDGRRLLVAAGNSVYVIDTTSDKVAATLQPGFRPTLVLALPGSERAYVASTESSFLRVIDLTTNELLDTVAELPTVPTAMAASPNGSNVYAASPGALYDLTKLTPDFFQPLAALAKARQAEAPFTLANASPGAGERSVLGLKNEAPDAIRRQRLAIERLLLTNDGQVLLRLGDEFRRGRLDPGSPFLDFQDPASGEALGASQVAAVAASPNGATLFFATSEQPRLIQSDSSCTVEQRSADLAEAPAAMALVSGPVEQQNCALANGGDGQVVVENTAFTLTIGDDKTPTGGVQGTVTTSPPGIVNCGLPFLIVGGAPTPFICSAGDVAGITDVEILVTSSLGCAIYNIKVAPQGATVDGLTKIFGDGISILRGSTFQLLVEAHSGGNPQGNLLLNVAATPGSPTVICPATVTTSGNGVATLNCSAGNVNVNTPVAVTASDSTNPSRTVTFEITVLATGNPSTGLNKVSADPRTVASESSFDLAVQAFSGTTPQNGLVLTVSSNSTLLACDAQATTDTAGLAEIACTASEVVANTQVQVTVGDGTRSVVFIVNIVPSGSLVDGLSIVSGDNQFVPRLSAFPLPLVVRAVRDGAPQQGVRLTVAPSLPFIVFCTAVALTDENGVAEINCGAANVAAPNFVTINVTDNSSPPRSLAEPFHATILASNPGVATDVEVLSELEVTGAVGETIADAVRVRAIGPTGAASGVPVHFSSNDDLSFNPPVGITDANGEVSTSVTFGCPARNTGTISIGLEANQALRTVDYQAVRGPLSALTKLGGDNQSGAAGQRLSQALLILAGDACRNAVPGLDVVWTVNPPEAAALETTSARTNNSGRASTLVRLLNLGGPFTISAAVEGFTAVFNLTTTAVANRMVLSSGNSQNVALGQASLQPLVVQVLSETDAGVNGVNVTFNVISGSGTVTPPSATTDGQGLAAATVTAGNAIGPIVVEATAVIQNESRTVRFTVNTVGRTPELTLLGFVNGASFRQGWVPGSTGTIFGIGLMEGVDGVALPPPNVTAALSPPGAAQAGGIWPLEFRGVSVTVNGIRAPILGLANVNGQEQINIQVPFGIPSPGVVPVVISNNGSSTTISGVQIETVRPGIFSVAVEGGSYAAALHLDFSLVTPSNPARPGEAIQLFVTGLGATNPPVGTNAVGPLPLARTVLPPTLTLDNAVQEVIENSAFYAPGLVTVYQINFVVGANAQSGNRELEVSVGGVNSPAVLLPVQR
jgi:uncharacterized protein (TIGR03437 family)